MTGESKRAASLPLPGGCQCGAVRYTLDAPAEDLYHCHCQMCRKIHGAVFATFAVVGVGDLTVEQGADRLASFESSPGTLRQFCGHCGCPLFCTVESRPGIVYFTAATLDDGAHPGHPVECERHIYVASKLPWYKIGDHLPQRDIV